MSWPSCLTAFDSAAGLQMALHRSLEGDGLTAFGLLPRPVIPFVRPIAAAAGHLPLGVRESLWEWGGRRCSIGEAQLDALDTEAMAEAVTAAIPRRPYPAVLIGSASGALIHLAAALGIPWLPQTFLLPVRHPGLDPDEPERAMAWGRRPAERILERDPDVSLHQVHDPSRDRPMLRHSALFRLKRRTLGRAYRAFLDDFLEPGGTIIVSDCRLRWPVSTIADRHVFQFGGFGDLAPSEHPGQGDQVERFLVARAARHQHWQVPTTDREVPEGEWGLDDVIVEDVLGFAGPRGFQVRRLSYLEPDDPSAAVASLVRRWYQDLGRPAERLLVDSFILTQPYWAMRTSSVPLWLVSTSERSVERLRDYLDQSEPWAEIRLVLYQQGTRSMGLAPLERWREQLARAQRRASTMALPPGQHPASPVTAVSLERAFARLEPQLPLPAQMPMEMLGSIPGLSRDRVDLTDLHPRRSQTSSAFEGNDDRTTR
jgi:hypothetical protein